MSTNENALIATLGANPELQYSEREKEIRIRFVDEYMQDRDALKAAIRCGFMASLAKEISVRFLEEPFVQSLIQAVSRNAVDPNNLPSNDEIKTTIITCLLHESTYRGAGSSQSARVAALSKLASLHGMDAPTKAEIKVEHRGGVMVVPSAIAGNVWEQSAMTTQAKLVTDVRD